MVLRRDTFVLIVLLSSTLLSSCLCSEFLVGNEVDVISVSPSGPTADFINSAAAFAVQSLNEKEKHADEFEVDTVQLTAAQIGMGTLYSATAEFSNGLRTEFSFLQPGSTAPAQHSLLPSGDEEEDGVAMFGPLERPLIDALTLEGPLVVSFPEARSDLRLRLPHEVDPGDVRKIKLAAGAAVNVTGLHSVRLLEPVEVELRIRHGRQPAVAWKQVPHLELHGTHLSFRSDQRTKVKRLGAQTIEFSNGNANQPVTIRNSLEFSSESGLLDYVQRMLTETRALSSSPNTHIRRLLAGQADAIMLAFFPVELVQPATGIHSLWNMLVTQDAWGNFKLVSYQQQTSRTEVTIEEAALVNGTWVETIKSLSNSLQAAR